ncbi:hypothetical protein ABIB25_002076 [Nakamurella sp. UYEF19]|uniref:AAA family ATPase n=1 Tax=Nakamurella sp. UYEF19 TaxID=1756392 RepID=UPI003391FF16
MNELIAFFVNNPDTGSGTFASKLKAQLADAGDDAIQVAAELLYVHALVASTTTWSARSKAELVNAVTGFRASGVSPMPPDLEVALAGGAAGTGRAYLNYRWKMFAYLIEVFAAIKRLPIDGRQSAFTSLGEFRRATAEVDTQSVWTQEYALQHLLFPDVAPPILSRNDRAKILSAFPEAGEDIFEVCASLEPNVAYGAHTFVNPYLSPLKQRWNPSDQETLYGRWAAKVAGTVDLDVEERNYKIERQPTFESAAQAAARGDNPYKELKLALSGFNVVDFRVTTKFLAWAESDPDGSGAALVDLCTDPGPASIDRFLSHVPVENLPGPGARLSVASTLLLGSAAADQLPPWRDTAARATWRLTGGYGSEAAATAGEVYLLWLERLDMIIAAVNAAPGGAVLRNRLDAQGLAYTMLRTDLDLSGWTEEEREAFGSWQQGRVTPPPPPSESRSSAPQLPSETQLLPAAGFDELAERLFLDQQGVAWLTETLILLERKRQIILQGPPGAGKTYLAQHVAAYLAGTSARVTTVQFHPGTSYEDFVQGLRPDPQDPTRFTVVDGPLIKIADAAQKEPTKTFVLVIDEINRGNIPAIFGELYLLLEYRDTPVTMLYGDRRKLPQNVLLIGTMNTADRSITALDSALRRRFYFLDLRPDQPPVDGILRRYLDSRAPHLMWLADLLDTANRAIDDPDQYIGPSHFMGEVDEAWARRAWSYSVMPTLRELYYNNPSRADALDFDILRESLDSH